MSLWRMIRGMFGHKPPPHDPAVKAVRIDAESRVAETRNLVERVRESAERRRLDNARRRYEERLYGTLHR